MYFRGGLKPKKGPIINFAPLPPINFGKLWQTVANYSVPVPIESTQPH